MTRHRPPNSIDKIIDLIDAADQTHTSCWRCQHHQATGLTGLCHGCRAFLLENADTDPRQPDTTPPPPPGLEADAVDYETWAAEFGPAFERIRADFADMVDATATQLACIVTRLHDAFKQAQTHALDPASTGWARTHQEPRP